MSTDASRFYYLRLMSRRTSTSGARSAFSKPKFVQWGEVKHFSTSLEENPELENQAMKIVRTVGQAFDVCQRINEPEKASTEDEERLKTPSTSSKKVSIGELPGTSGEFEKLDKPRKRLSSESGTRQRKSSNEPGCLDIARQRKSSSRTPSPSPSFTSLKPPDVPPSPRPPDKLGTSGGEVNRSISLTETSVVNPNDSVTRKESGGSHFHSSTLANIPSLTCGGVETAQTTITSPLSLDSFIQAHSPSLHHQISSPGALHYAVSNKTNGSNPPLNRPPTLSISPSIAVNPAQTNPFYQNAAQQLLLKSSELLSPGRMPSGAGMGASVEDHFLPGLCTYSSYDALNQQQPTTLGQSIEHHSVTLLRTQLEQAQQQAQVAIAQVYLLRDQLASETTARIESQIRTQQLTQSNRELIDQVQVLVTRLQNLETRLSGQTTNAPPQAAPIQLLTTKSPERSISLQEPTRINVPRLSLNIDGAGAQLDVPSPSSAHSARSEPAWPSATRRSPDTHRQVPELLQNRLSADQKVKGESKKKLQRRKTVMCGDDHLLSPEDRYLEPSFLEKEPSMPGKARKASLRLSPVQAEKQLRKISDSAMLPNRTSSVAREARELFHQRPKSMSLYPSTGPHVIVAHNELARSEEDEDESEEEDIEKDVGVGHRRKSPILADRESPVMADKREKVRTPSRTPSLTSPSGTTAGKLPRIKNTPPAVVEGHRTVSLPSPKQPNVNRLKSSLKRSSAVIGPAIPASAHPILENHLGEKDSSEEEEEEDDHQERGRGKHDSSTSSTDDHVTSGTTEFQRRKSTRRSLRGTSSTASPKQRMLADDDRSTSRSDYRRMNSLQEQRPPRTPKNLDPRR